MASKSKGEWAMAKPRIFFFCPDLSHVLGGVRQTYRHVDVLNANGFDAWIVHRKAGFKVKWFEHHTRVMYEPAPVGKRPQETNYCS